VTRCATQHSPRRAGRGLCSFFSGTSAHEELDVELWVHVPFGIGGLVPELDVPELPEAFELLEELDGLELLAEVPDEVDEAGVLDVVVLVVVPESARAATARPPMNPPEMAKAPRTWRRRSVMVHLLPTNTPLTLTGDPGGTLWARSVVDETGRLGWSGRVGLAGLDGKRPGGTTPDLVDDCLGRRTVRVDPRVPLGIEHRPEPSCAVARVLADLRIEADGDVLSDVGPPCHGSSSWRLERVECRISGTQPWPVSNEGAQGRASPRQRFRSAERTTRSAGRPTPERRPSPRPTLSLRRGAGMFSSPTAEDLDRVLPVAEHGAAGCSDFGSSPTVP